jgi:hypothetical protein
MTLRPAFAFATAAAFGSHRFHNRLTPVLGNVPELC